LKAAQEHASVRHRLEGQTPVRTMATVKDTVEFVDENYNRARVIVAGGLYLAGAVRSIVHRRREK
jgi:folylpolyglutamate synthase/dihydropteroate synthase